MQQGSTAILVPIDNSLDYAVHASLLLEWLSTDELVIGSARQALAIEPGRTTADVPLRIPTSTIWLRLRYSVTPDPSAHVLVPQVLARLTGILSLPEIAAHVFELKVSYAGAPRRGSPITVFAQGVQPVTRASVPDVEWHARLYMGGTEIAPVKIVRHTEGLAEITFQTPPSAASKTDDEDKAEVKITGRCGDFERTVSAEMDFANPLSAQLQTDKTIYQPGQAIHIRAIVLDPQGRTATEVKVNLAITSQDGERVHAAHLISSQFGIVHEDWTLPGNAGLGDYQIALTTEGDDHYRIGSHAVRVSRYELPAFTVSAKPDRSAYLPGQQPAVMVTGAYLFGKPVPKGNVKVIRYGHAIWNPKTRQAESTDETVAAGEAGNNGVFVAHLDVSADRKDIAETEDERFEDLHFAAFYTDPQSGRTEQRRFDVRITRESIHVYLIRGEANEQKAGPVYLSTDYADGRPASASVEIRFAGRWITLHTNRYGVGKTYLSLGGEQSDKVELRALDSSGLTGTWTEDYWDAGDDRIGIDSERTLYRAGEPVTLRISVPPNRARNGVAILNAVVDNQPVARQLVHLVNGRASVLFPYQPEFRRTVTFVAWNDSDGPAGNILGTRAVIFPDGSTLHVTAAADRTVYLPGEKSSIRFQVSSADGKPVEAALGLAVVDQSVVERARTESEFGGRSWFACGFCASPGETELGGVRSNDLYALKSTLVIAPELDLVAEALVAHSIAVVETNTSETFQDEPKFKRVASQMADLESLLTRHYADTLELPHDSAAFTAIAGRIFTEMRDPWGMPYSVRFGTNRADSVLEVVSSGPDKRSGTDDDFIAGAVRRKYFAPYSFLISQILKQGVNYPATDVEFRQQLKDNGLLLDAVRDPWGTPYEARVTTSGAHRFISLKSAGPDGKFGTNDDVHVARFSGSYFQREHDEIAKALESVAMSPRTIEEFKRILTSAGIDASRFHDAWDKPYRVKSHTFSRYSDRVDSTSFRTFGNPHPATRTSVTPVTQQVITFSLRSAGPDGIEDTFDDFDVADFSVVLREETPEVKPDSSVKAATLQPGTGFVRGVVTDPSGGAIQNVHISLADQSQSSYETDTESDGTFELNSVPAGAYSLKAVAPGFMAYVVAQVPVNTGKVTTVNVELQVGITAQQVTVEAGAPPLDTDSAQLAPARTAVATPKVRDYFPETLLWEPEIITDSSGRATRQVSLADSVTTWKIAVIASSRDGRIAEAESDLRTFQPFFLDFNPPPALTAGDRLDLPVTVHNYQDREQKVSLDAQANDWFSLDGSRTRQVQVPANASANVSWAVQAKGMNDNARQRISAVAGRNRDAIEKPIRIHPDGQEVVQTQSKLVAARTEFVVSIPPAAIQGATRAELRLYPSVASMLLESADTILETPHGCAEQTISAGYANLVALRYAKAVGISNPRIAKKATTNITAARDALAAFVDADGGVRYWATGKADVAVTAYALTFLLEVSTILPMDKDELALSVRWLEKQQRDDGTWPSRINNSHQEILLTSLVARALAAAQKAGVKTRPGVLVAAYNRLDAFTDQIDEPYMLAQFMLAALDSGDDRLLGDRVKKLSALGHDEAGGMFWDLQTNSPFYGWGRAGRFETTALVVSALSAWRSAHSASPEFDPPIRRGLSFLVSGRDREGSWFSTQATLRAMKAIADSSPLLGIGSSAGGAIEVRANGRLVKTISFSNDTLATDPIRVNASAFLVAGETRLDLLQPSAGPLNWNLVRFSASHWIAWTQTQPRSSPELRLAVHYDRYEVTVGEPIRCSVKAERIGFRGYGMMLAEIGLPPGAEVDRSSLDLLLEDASLGVNRYDVLPDRVIFYLWPEAGGASFNFLMRVRMPMLAKSAASVLYDYYNPEALSEVAPISWRVN